LRFSRKHKKRT